jgi:ABC-type sugar transport system ATPase subunit
VISVTRSIAAAGTGVVLVTHDLTTVRQLADRIVVLSLGRVVYDDPVHTLSADQLWGLMATGTHTPA